MATEFICTHNLTGETHADMATWEANTQVDLTAAATKVANHSGKSGTLLANGDAVQVVAKGITATVAFCTDPTSHTSISQGQIMLHTIAGGTLASGDKVEKVGTPTDFVTLNSAPDSAIAVLELHSDDGDITENNVTLAGATGDATNYRMVTGRQDQHTGTRNTGARININGADNNFCCIILDESYSIFEKMECKSVTSNNNAYGIRLTSNGRTGRIVRKNLIYDLSSTSNNAGVFSSISSNTAGNHIHNNFIINCKTGLDMNSPKWDNNYHYNNSLIDCVVGVEQLAGSNNFLKNNLVLGNATDYTNSGATQNETYNASSDGTVDTISTPIDSGTTTAGTNTTTLIETGQNFLATVSVGDWVNNSTRSGSAKVQSVDSNIQLTLESAITGQTSGDSYEIDNSIGYTPAADNFTNVGSGTEDLSLKSGATAIDEGEGPGADANVPTDDIFDNPRAGARTSMGANNPVPGVTPVITDISPPSGTTNGGTQVTITGTDFKAAQGAGFVTFDGVAAASYVSWADTQIVVTTPAHVAGAVDVVVQNDDGNSDTDVGGFTYTVQLDSVTPPSGPLAGGNQVTIAGHGFLSAQGGGTVTFGGVAATAYASWSDTQIVCTVPAGAALGAVDVVMTNNDTDSATLVGGYTYAVTGNIRRRASRRNMTANSIGI